MHKPNSPKIQGIGGDGCCPIMTNSSIGLMRHHHEQEGSTQTAEEAKEYNRPLEESLVGQLSTLLSDTG